VTIINASLADLRIGGIDVINHTNQFGASITISAVTTSDFHYTQETAPGPTRIEILETSAGHVLLAGHISNPYGSTLVSSTGGNIVQSTTLARIDSDVVELLAPAGAVGSAAAPIRIAASRLTARGDTGVYIEELAGDMNVVEASANLTSGVVSLRAAGSILDVHVFTDAAVSAHDVILVAATGSIGSTGDALDVDVGGNSLDASASGAIVVVDVSGAMGVGTVMSTNGDVRLSTTDTDAAGETIELAADSSIRALSGAITLLSADDILTAFGSVIVARNVVTMRADDEDEYDGVAGNDPDRDIGRGASVELRGAITGGSVVITTGADPDAVSLTNVTSATSIDTGANADAIRIGSLASATTNAGGVLDQVAANLTVEGGSGDDTLSLDDSGDTRDNSGTVTATQVAGFGMTGTITYSGVDDLVITLGGGVDTATIGSTASTTTTTIRGGDSADTFRVGDAARGLNDVAGFLQIDGQGGDDAVFLSDAVVGAGATLANAGRLEANRLTGLGMGSVDQTAIDPDHGIGFDNVASVDLVLGGGVDTLTVVGTSTSTSVDTGGGRDRVVLGDIAPGGGLAAIGAPLVVLAGADGGDLAISSGARANLVLDRVDSARGRVTEAGATGRVDFEGFSTVSVELGGADDALRIVDTVTTVDVRTGGGADTVTIDDISHAVTVSLGLGADSLVVRDAGAALSVSGEGGASDRDALTLDLSVRTTAVTTGAVNGSGSAGSLTGFTAGAIAFDTVESVSVLLGSGNDTVAIGHGLSTADVRVDGGAGDDGFLVTAIGGGLTTLTGQAAFDTVTVVIPGVPLANSFTNLRLDAERLVVDNRTNTTTPVVWTVTDGAQVDANVGAGTVPVIFAEGVDEIRVLGGTRADTLNVVSTLPSDTDGLVDGDRVELSAGAEVLEAAGSAQYRDYQAVIGFDGLAAGTTLYTEDGFTVSALAGNLARDDSRGAAASFASGSRRDAHVRHRGAVALLDAARGHRHGHAGRLHGHHHQRHHGPGDRGRRRCRRCGPAGLHARRISPARCSVRSRRSPGR
jgi:hypothetical protein